MELTDRIKATSIENKWFSSIMKQMNSQRIGTPTTRFSFKKDDSTENIYPDTSPGKNIIIDLNMDFQIVLDTNTVDEKDLKNENEFLEEIRFFTVDEAFDTITLSSKLLQDENLFTYFINFFSKNQAFTNFSK
jgi:hypothetical protein